MLILTRDLKKNEIVLGDNLIKIKLLSVRGCQVRLGIDAPEDLSIYREEVFYKVKNGDRKELISNSSFNFKEDKE